MSYEDRTYVIFNASDSGSIDFSQVFESHTGSLRLNSSGSQTFVKWSGSTPTCVSSLSIKSDEYTWLQMKDILTGSAWSFAIPGEDASGEDE